MNPTVLICLALTLALAATAQPLADPLAYTGVNLAGAEFGGVSREEPAIHGRGYIYAGGTDYAYFAWYGANVFRLPFHWENLQREPRAALDADELGRLRGAVEMATERGYVVILDPHNYARYYGAVIGSEQISSADFADFWSKLATVFGDNPLVWFGLVNEPHGISAQDWFKVAAEAVAAIRAAGATNLILLPGTAYSGAHSWLADWYGGSNAAAVAQVKDPLDHFVLEVHQYLDPDSSGTKPDVPSPTIGSERLAGFVAWCRENGYRAFLGEFGVPPTPEGQAALADMLTSMERDRDVWLGWSWWAAGPWWGADYMFSIQPNPGEKPQMAWLEPHLAGGRTAPVKVQFDGEETTHAVPSGQLIEVGVPPAPAGQVFVRWTGDTAFLADPTQPRTVLTVPFRDCRLGVEWGPAAP